MEHDDDLVHAAGKLRSAGHLSEDEYEVVVERIEQANAMPPPAGEPVSLLAEAGKPPDPPPLSPAAPPVPRPTVTGVTATTGSPNRRAEGESVASGARITLFMVAAMVVVIVVAFIVDSNGKRDYEPVDVASDYSDEPTTTEAPWYPAEFKEGPGDSIAWRFMESGEFSCDYGSGGCWGIEVVARWGCDRIYAELTILDERGTVVDYTNAVANGVRSEERAELIFSSFDDGADKGRLAELNCY